MSLNIDIGDRVKLTVVFEPETGHTLPAEVTLQVRDPDGTITSFDVDDVTEVETDSYRYDFLVTKSGRHTYRWASEGSVDAAEEGFFIVRKSGVLPDP